MPGRWRRWTLIAFALMQPPLAAPVAAAGDSAASLAYDGARRLFFQLKESKQKRRFRHNWFRVITAFERFVREHPESAEAAKALYTAAELWSDLYAVSRVPSDLDHALDAYRTVTQRFPSSSLADDALWQRFLVHERRGQVGAARQVLGLLLSSYPNGDMAARAKEAAARLGAEAPGTRTAGAASGGTSAGRLVGRRVGAQRAAVSEIKHWSNPGYSRIAVYLASPATAQAEHVSGATVRVHVDIREAQLPEGKSFRRAIDDQLLAAVDATQLDPETVRLTVDIKGQQAIEHRLLVMENPYRVVLDVATTQGALWASGRPRVVLDPGHGGKDKGATGPRGTHEKDVVLRLSTAVARHLRERGVDVELTRSDDTFVPLEERTAIANRFGAHAFVSIHANSHKQREVRGVETYYLDVTDDRYALRLAALENATQEEQVSDVQLILTDLATKASTEGSVRLARAVHTRLLEATRRLDSRAKDLGVKASLFYVLLGARMPAVLVEAAFISNPEHERMLASDSYLRAAPAAIAAAVLEYLGVR